MEHTIEKKQINIDETISKAAKEAAKELLSELKAKKYIKNEISYFRKVEILLYQYNNLKTAIKQKEEDIKYIKEHGLPEKSKSIVMYQTSGGNISSEERYMQLIEKYNLEKIETEREVKRIDNALSKIKKDKYYKIVELKYLNSDKDMTDEEIAEVLDKDQSTVSRNRKRLINKIKTILFPESIKELA